VVITKQPKVLVISFCCCLRLRDEAWGIIRPKFEASGATWYSANILCCGKKGYRFESALIIWANRGANNEQEGSIWRTNTQSSLIAD